MAVAAVTVGRKISILFACHFDTMGATMEAYAGQKTGARKLDRVTDGIKACSLIAIVYSTIACVVLIVFGEEMSLLFVDGKETEVIKNAAILLKWSSLFFFPLALVNIVRFTIQGMGFGNLAIIAGVCEMIAHGMVGFILVPVFGYIAACFAGPIAWIMADAFLIPAYLYVLKKLKNELNSESYSTNIEKITFEKEA